MIFGAMYGHQMYWSCIQMVGLVHCTYMFPVFKWSVFRTPLYTTTIASRLHILQWGLLNNT